MPRHWRPIKPPNPGPKKRVEAVEKAARAAGAEALFVGQEKGSTRWFALVDVKKMKDPDIATMWGNIGTAPGNTMVLEGGDELEPGL